MNEEGRSTGSVPGNGATRILTGSTTPSCFPSRPVRWCARSWGATEVNSVFCEG